MKDPVDLAQQRAFRYWYVDGLAEIAIGSMLLMLGLLFYAINRLPSHPAYLILPGLVLPVVVFIAGRLGGRVVRRLKTSITSPRTGYIAYSLPSSRRHKLSLIIVTISILGLFIVVVALAPTLLQWASLLDGLLLGVLLLIMAQGLVRFYLLSILAFSLGIWNAWMGTGGNLGHAIFYTLLGLAIIVSGGLTLWQYLRQNPLQEAT